MIDAPADKTSSQRDPVESDFNDDFDAGLDPESGWAKADALLSELDAPTPTPTPELPDIPADTTPAAAIDDDPLAQADAHMSFGLYDDALDALDTALEGDRTAPNGWSSAPKCCSMPGACALSSLPPKTPSPTSMTPSGRRWSKPAPGRA